MRNPKHVFKNSFTRRPASIAFRVMTEHQRKSTCGLLRVMMTSRTHARLMNPRHVGRAHICCERQHNFFYVASAAFFSLILLILKSSARVRWELFDDGVLSKCFTHSAATSYSSTIASPPLFLCCSSRVCLPWFAKFTNVCIFLQIVLLFSCLNFRPLGTSRSFSAQVGGHTAVVSVPGSQFVAKPVGEKRKEYTFYQRAPDALRPFIPKFFGEAKFRVPYSSSPHISDPWSSLHVPL